MDLAGFIGLKFLLQFLVLSPEYDLHRDEYLYLDQAQHLAWGYVSVPPVTSWISSVIYALGNSVFCVKFFPALFGALTLLVVWKTIETLKGGLFALVLGATCVLFSALLRLNTLYQPNSLDILCWTTLFFVIINYFNTERPKWLFIAAVVFAIGFLNKYNIVFLMTAQRKIFVQKKLYLAVVFALMLILPNLIWQYNNDFPVIRHLGELAETQLVHVDRFGFLQSQLHFFIGSLFVWVSGLYALLFYRPFRKYRPFLGAFFFTLIIFIYFRAKDYYAIGLYPIYIAFGAVFLGHLLKEGWNKYVRPVDLAIPLLVFIPIFPYAFPNKSPEYIIRHASIYKKYGLLRWEDGKDHTLCDNYGQTGAINYYTQQGIQAVTFNADYINWFNLDRNYVNLIRVKDYGEKDSEFEENGPFFDTSVVADSITNRHAREYKTWIFAFTGAKVDVNKRIKAKLRK